MFRFVTLVGILAVLANANDDLPDPNVRIIGGSHASHGQFPFQVSLEYQGRQHCGGAIIAAKVILTAAHCLDGINPTGLSVLAGTVNRLNGGVRARVSSVVKHGSYSTIPSITHDIAILHLDRALPFSSTVKAATLPSNNEAIHNNVVATVSGWGSEYHQGPPTYALKYANIPLWSRSQCIRHVPNLHATHLCAGDAAGQRNSCPGDSGGPLSVGNKVIGVVSFGFGCGSYSKPAMYTYVAGLRPWIQKHAGV